ncbi:MAG: hypothetical protein ABEJ07_04915 [Candidatus Nanohaloarchaea archaeon]
MDDKLIASYLETDGSKTTYMPHLENAEASWESGTGLTLSSEGREQFFPSHRILEVNRFTDPESYAWYSIQNDPIIEQFWDGDSKELRAVLDQLSSKFDSANFDELKRTCTSTTPSTATRWRVRSSASRSPRRWSNQRNPSRWRHPEGRQRPDPLLSFFFSPPRALLVSSVK